MKIEIAPDVWDLWERSWNLFGVKDEKELVRMLELQMLEESQGVLEDAKNQMPFDCPAAAVQRTIGMLKEKKLRKKP